MLKKIKEIAIISGKGGTGKTSLTGSLSVLLKNKIICDCDVDAPDLHLLLNPEIKKKTDFVESAIAQISETCSLCGECVKVCKFDAIEIKNKRVVINEIKCEGCSFCVRICPEKKLTIVKEKSGEVYISKTNYGWMSHALLFSGEENTGKLASRVRDQARDLGENLLKKNILIDGPPGTGCATIATITGVDIAVIVTEPTVSGKEDMQRAINLCNYFNVKSMVCINKYDINYEKTEEIKKYCEDNNIKIIGEIPFDKVMNKAIIAGKPVVEFSPNHKISKILKGISKKLKSLLKEVK